MTYRNERGAVLPIALLIILVLLVLAVGFFYDARTQSGFNSAIKTHSFSRAQGESILRKRIALINSGNGYEEWLTATESALNFVADWRLGSLLKGGFDTDYPELGILLETSFPSDSIAATTPRPEINAGLLPLDYRLYVRNNRDDPSYLLATTDVNGQPMDGDTWDTDGKVIFTVQVFKRGDDAFDAIVDVPVVTISAMVQSTGYEFVILGLDPGSEGDDLTTSLNAGRGSDDAGTNPDETRDLGLQDYSSSL